VSLKVGDSVRVRLPRKGGVQDGTVTAVLPDGSFKWKNRCNYERKSDPSRITSEPERGATLSPYMQTWVDEDEDEACSLAPGTRRG
jgi:hypothetical protein